MDTVTVLTFNEPEEAQPIKTRLEQAGIPTEVHDERNLQRFGFLAQPLAGIRVRVQNEKYESARKLLNQWHQQDQLLAHAIHCPSCNSSRIEYPQFTRKFILPYVGLMLCRLGMLEAKFYCQECQFTWPPKQKVEPPTDSLGWPKK